MPGYEIHNPWILNHEDYKSASAAHDVASNVKDTYEKMIKNRAEAKYEKNGGCSKCRGRGWVVAWDTMDSMTGCYAEYGPCDKEACTPATRSKSGLMPVNTKYDGFNHGSTWTLYSEMSKDEGEWYQDMIVAPAEKAEGLFAKVVRDLVKEAKPKAGTRVRVSPRSGRKVGNHDVKSEAGKGRVEPGTEGIITWCDAYEQSRTTYFGTTRFGTFEGRACIALTDAKFPNGKFRDIAWINLKHLEIIS